jgi:hypothetical protein
MDLLYLILSHTHPMPNYTIKSYFSKQDWCFIDLKPWIFLIAYLFVHVIYDFEVLSLLLLIQTLHIRWNFRLFEQV